MGPEHAYKANADTKPLSPADYHQALIANRHATRCRRLPARPDRQWQLKPLKLKPIEFGGIPQLCPTMINASKHRWNDDQDERALQQPQWRSVVSVPRQGYGARIRQARAEHTLGGSKLRNRHRPLSQRWSAEPGTSGPPEIDSNPCGCRREYRYLTSVLQESFQAPRLRAERRVPDKQREERTTAGHAPLLVSFKGPA